MADPGAAFPAGDPRNAVYWETVGKLEHGRERTLKELGERRAQAKAGATYKEGQLTQQEPQTYAANRYRGVREGIASSGTNSERRGGIATNYANRRFSVQQGLKNTEGSIARSEQEARERTDEGLHSASTRALAEGQRNAEEHPPAPAAAAAPPMAVAPAGTVAQMQQENRERAIRAMRKGRGY